MLSFLCRSYVKDLPKMFKNVFSRYNVKFAGSTFVFSTYRIYFEILFNCH